MNVMLAAIDIGGTKIRLVVATSPENILAESVFPTPPDQASALATMASELLKLAGQSAIRAIGIASPGPLDRSKGIILTPHNIPWHNVHINDYFTSEFGCPVVLEHDATAGGVAEARLGAGKGSRVVLYVSIATGIGTSIIVDGQPLPTKYNSEGGLEVIEQGGGTAKHFEELGSGKAILRDYGKIARDIHNKSDWDHIAHILATGIFDMITIVEPDVVVLAGGVSVHFDKFIAPLTKHMAKLKPLYPLPPIIQARFVETAPIVGMLLLSQELLKKK